MLRERTTPLTRAACLRGDRPPGSRAGSGRAMRRLPRPLARPLATPWRRQRDVRDRRLDAYPQRRVCKVHQAT
eukprot:scaffold122985_cov24-Tisochrysis_lutea.AAC.1